MYQLGIGGINKMKMKCLLLITSSSEVSLFKRFISMHNN